MPMRHFPLLPLLGVTILASLKTFVVMIALGRGSGFDAGAAAIFVAFWLLTAGVFLLAMLIRRRQGQRRRARFDHDPDKVALIETFAPDWGLTRAEVEVAILAVKGFSNAEIAAMRGSALQTVKTQMGAIYRKSGLENRYQLIAFITDEVCNASASQNARGAEIIQLHQVTNAIPRLRQSR
jgi:DNA-binding CsgD family transcriptional regulator